MVVAAVLFSLPRTSGATIASWTQGFIVTGITTKRAKCQSLLTFFVLLEVVCPYCSNTFNMVQLFCITVYA